MKFVPKMPLLTVALVALVLSGCGGRSNNDVVVKPNDPPVIVVMIDAFAKYVTDLVASLSEDKEPNAIADVAVTTPDDSEPVVVK